MVFKLEYSTSYEAKVVFTSLENKARWVIFCKLVDFSTISAHNPRTQKLFAEIITSAGLSQSNAKKEIRMTAELAKLIFSYVQMSTNGNLKRFPPRVESMNTSQGEIDKWNKFATALENSITTEEKLKQAPKIITTAKSISPPEIEKKTKADELGIEDIIARVVEDLIIVDEEFQSRSESIALAIKKSVLEINIFEKFENIMSPKHLEDRLKLVSAIHEMYIKFKSVTNEAILARKLTDVLTIWKQHYLEKLEKLHKEERKDELDEKTRELLEQQQEQLTELGKKIESSSNSSSSSSPSPSSGKTSAAQTVAKQFAKSAGSQVGMTIAKSLLGL